MANEIGLTEVTATRQQLVASIVQETLKQNALLLGTITDYSAFAQPGASQVSVPRRDQFAAANKAENTDLTAQELTFSADVISLNLHKAIYSKLERIAQVQSNVAVEAEIIREMANELALQVDKDIITELLLASTAAPDHTIVYNDTTNNDIEVVDILEARRLLNVQNVPMMNRFMLISPDREKEMLSIANFVEVDKYGPGAQPLASGELGRIYGFRVLMHNEIPATDTIFYHSSAVGFAQQLQPEFRSDFQLRSASQEYLLHHIYGVEVLDGGKRQVVIEDTP